MGRLGRNIFFFGPERIDKFRRIFILILIGFFFFLLIHFVALAFIQEETQREAILGIAFGLIPEFVGSVAVYWVLDSSIKQLYGISELPDLPLDVFVGELRSAKRIRILETFTKLANDPHLREKFTLGIKDALRSGAEVEILLIHPYSEGAKQRAEELARVGIRVEDEIRKSLARFYKLQSEISRDSSIMNGQSNLEIRLYDASPSIAMHMWDRDAYLSFFPVKKRSDEAPNLKISMATTFGHYAAAKFDELWNHSETIALSSHMELRVIIPDGDPPDEMLYCLRAATDDAQPIRDDSQIAGETLLSFYVTNHLSSTLQELLDDACTKKEAAVQLVAEERSYIAKCKKLPSSSSDDRVVITKGYRQKYDWDLEEIDAEIRKDPIIYKVELSAEIDVA